MKKMLSLEIAESIMSWFKSGMMRWHYEDGLVVLSVMKLSESLGRRDLFEWAYGMYSPLVSDDGGIRLYRMGEYNLDQVNPAKVLIPLYEKTGEERFRKAAGLVHAQLEGQPRTKSGVFWHKEIYPWQIWLDGLYMAQPFRIMYAQAFGDDGCVDDVVRQLTVTFDLLKDRRTGLLLHAYDESRGMRWSNVSSGTSMHVWARALGWYLMAVLDISEMIRNDHPDKAAVLDGIAGGLLKNLLDFQTEEGMWYQVIDCGDRPGNYLETSASSMFAYSLFKASRLGMIDGAVGVEAARKALDGIIGRYLSKDGEGLFHLGGICSVAGLGGNPYRDGSFEYYVSEKVVADDFKGVGPFLMALIEGEQENPSSP